MNSGYFFTGDIRRFTATVGVAGVSLLFALDASAQNQIPDFIERKGLEDTNIGRAAIGVQVTCGQLIAIGANQQPNGDGQENELWRRCNELVVTADERNTGTPTARTLGYSTDEELLAAFQQVNGEDVQASANLSQTASYDQFSTIGARLEALRGGSSASVTSVAANGGEFMYGSGGGAAADSAASPFGSWGWFVRGTYTSGDRDPSEAAGFAGQENGFDYTQYGFTVGIDRRSGNAVWGFALGYNSYEVEMQNAAIPGIETPIVEGGKIETDSINGTFFYDVASQNDVYFSALAGFGGQSFDMARNFVYFSNNTAPGTTVVDQERIMTAVPDGSSFSAAFTLGRTISRGGWVFDPYIGMTHDHVTIDRFAEADSGNTATGDSLAGMQLAFDRQKIDSFRTRLGFQISNNVNTSFGSVRPMLSAEWFHELEDKPRVIRAKYALEDDLAGQGRFTTGFGSGCVSCFDIISEAPETDYFVVGLGVAATTQRGFQSFLMVEGLLGHSYLSAYALTVGLRGQF